MVIQLWISGTPGNERVHMVEVTRRLNAVFPAEEMFKQYTSIKEDYPKLDLVFQPSRIETDDLLFIDDDFYIQQVEGPLFYLTSIHNDPENPVSIKETAQRMVDILSPDAMAANPSQYKDTGERTAAGARIFKYVPENTGVKPQTFWGAYFNSVKEAIDASILWKTLPLSDWPKCYFKPIDSLPKESS